MGGLFSRFTVIENNTGVPAELRECANCDPDGTSLPAIMLESNSSKLITAREYHENCIDSGIPRAIKFYSNGLCFKTLYPQDFIANIKLKVINNDGQMEVNRVKATVKDMFRIRALACCLVDLTGRPEEQLQRAT